MDRARLFVSSSLIGKENKHINETSSLFTQDKCLTVNMDESVGLIN
jgi:hypothetical protein